MPRRSFSHQVQSVWDHLTRRRDFRRPRRYADAAAAQRRSQTLDSRSHVDESLVSFGQFMREGGRLSARSTAGTAHIPLDAGGFSDQHLIDYSINRSTIYCDPPEETVRVPVVRCATSHPNAPDEGQEIDHPVWYLPGDGFLLRSKIPDIDADVLTLLLGIQLCPSGFIGHEDGINLPLMLAALSFSFDHSLDFEIDNLKNTISRYIVARMFHHNPHSKSFSLGKEYFKFRSGEIYRAWIAVTKDERLQRVLTPDDLVLLYICMVQYKWWPDLVRGYEHRFNSNLLQEYGRYKGDIQDKFEETFKLFLSRTCFGKHPWMEKASESPPSEGTSEKYRHSPTAGPSSIFQAPFENPGNSDNADSQLRHVRRETSITSAADNFTDLIELYE
ncbi:hypothetical protein ACHAP8_006341 [Fusarium lateritium]